MDIQEGNSHRQMKFLVLSSSLGNIGGDGTITAQLQSLKTVDSVQMCKILCLECSQKLSGANGMNSTDFKTPK